MQFNTYIYIYIHNKICRNIARCNREMPFLLDFKRQ